MVISVVADFYEYWGTTSFMQLHGFHYALA